jgi:Uma2 family endonuclease
MSLHAHRKMTVDEFLTWAEGREGRWELYNGVAYGMPPERMGHIKTKVAVYLLRTAGLNCRLRCREHLRHAQLDSRRRQHQAAFVEQRSQGVHAIFTTRRCDQD